MGGTKGDGCFQHSVDPSAEYAFVWAGHAHVALESGAAGQNLFIGCGHVGVRAQHCADAAIQIPPHQLLVAGGLGMKIHQHHLDLGRQTGQQSFGGLEWAIDRRHEHPAQQHENGHFDLVGRLQDHHVCAGCLGRIVCRADNAIFGLKRAEDFPTPISMVAQRYTIDSGG